MTENILNIRKQYQDDRPLTKRILDLIVDEIQSWGSTEVRNRKQMILDIFSAGYNCDGDGRANLSKSLQDQMDFPLKSVFHYDFNDTAGNISATILTNVHWAVNTTNSTATIANESNGVAVLATNGGIVGTPEMYYRFENFDPLLYPSFEAYVKIDDITATEFYVGWRSIATPTDDYAYFIFDSAVDPTYLYVKSRNNGATAISLTTSIAMLYGVYVKLRVQLYSTSEVKFFVNDVEVAHAFTGTIDALTDFVPFIKLSNKATEILNLSVDYARIVQNRSL